MIYGLYLQIVIYMFTSKRINDTIIAV